MDKTENILKLIFDTQSIAPHDDLSKIIDSTIDSELTEDDLDFVAAAGPDYERFKSKIK